MKTQGHRTSAWTMGNMFNVGAGEIMVIILLALIVFGPDKLPELMRTVGKWNRTLKTLQKTVNDEWSKVLEATDLNNHTDNKSTPAEADDGEMLEEPPEDSPEDSPEESPSVTANAGDSNNEEEGQWAARPGDDRLGGVIQVEGPSTDFT